jgi:hypothetical protein
MLLSLVVVADHCRLLMIANADEERDVGCVPMKTMVVCRSLGWIGGYFHICEGLFYVRVLFGLELKS